MGLAVKEYCKRLCLAAALAGMISGALRAQEDPPSRVARLNFISGNVSMQPPGINDWGPAEVNHPFTIGDYLYTDANARAELHTDEAVIRMGSQTSFGFLNLNDAVVQIKLTGGDMSFRLHDVGQNQVFEVDTPNAAVQLARDGVYRFRVDPNGNMTFIVVRSGQAQVTGDGQSFALDPGNSAQVTGTDQLAFDVERAPAPDEFDEWSAGRDAREAHLAAARYVPPTVIGSEDLDAYGDWQPAPEYGPVWYPRQVPSDWAPYQSGHWAWVEPWGWTWIDAAPWGFAPFHYGRWAYIRNRWGWCPGPIAVGYHGPVVRPYYAPALVAWFGGSHWGVTVSSGGPSLGWVPLGIGEVYTPSYRCSRPYFSNVNVNNTRVVNTVNITNVYNTVYVNKTVYNQQFVNSRAPNGAYSMRQSSFASGQPVPQGGGPVSRAQFEQFRSSGAVLAPATPPQRQALLANNAERVVARPTPQVLNRPVMAVQAPASAPVSFQSRQQYLQSHAGQVHDSAAMHQQVANQALNQVSIVRAEPKAQVVQVRPGEQLRGGHAVPPTQPAVSSAGQAAQARPFGSSPNPQPPGNPRIPASAQPVAAVPTNRAREQDQPRPDSRFDSRPRAPQNNVPIQHQEIRSAPSQPGVQPRSAPPPQPSSARPQYTPPEVREIHPRVVEPPPVHEPPPTQHEAPPAVRAAPPPVQSAPPVVHAVPPPVQSAPPAVHAVPPPVLSAPPAVHAEQHSAPAKSEPERRQPEQKNDEHKNGDHKPH